MELYITTVGAGTHTMWVRRGASKRSIMAAGREMLRGLGVRYGTVYSGTACRQPVVDVMVGE